MLMKHIRKIKKNLDYFIQDKVRLLLQNLLGYELFKDFESYLVNGAITLYRSTFKMEKQTWFTVLSILFLQKPINGMV